MSKGNGMEERKKDRCFPKAGFKRIKIFQHEVSSPVKKFGSSRWMILSLTTKITHQKKELMCS
jgi:hypothetical protein